HLFEGTNELKVVGASKRLPRSEGGGIGRAEQAAPRRDRAAGIGDAVHVKDHFAIQFITDADEVMPGVVRGHVAASHVHSTGCVANKEPKRMASGPAVEVELLAATTGALSDEAAVVRLRPTIGPALNGEGGIARGGETNRHAAHVTVHVGDRAE